MAQSTYRYLATIIRVRGMMPYGLISHKRREIRSMQKMIFVKIYKDRGFVLILQVRKDFTSFRNNGGLSLTYRERHKMVPCQYAIGRTSTCSKVGLAGSSICLFVIFCQVSRRFGIEYVYLTCMFRESLTDIQ